MKKRGKFIVGMNHAIMFMFCFGMVVIPFGCSAKADMQVKESISMDSLVHNALGDSLYSVITTSKRVMAVLPTNPADKESLPQEVRLDKKFLPVVEFILTDSKNYESNAIVYGLFRAGFTLVFEQRSKSYNAEFDFGLKKWRICDAAGNVLMTFDLKSSEMLRFATRVFPEDANLRGFLDTDKNDSPTCK